MSKRNRKQNNPNQNVPGVMGPYGPVVQTKTTIGVNTARIANARPATLRPSFPLSSLSDLIVKEGSKTGRHLFGHLVSTSALPVDFIPGVMTKDANYVCTNSDKYLIASQTTVTDKISNGRRRLELCIPYYDREAYATLSGSAQTFGAIAPMGSFKVGIDVHGGGILTGTDAAGMLAVDKILLAGLSDLMNVLAENVAGNKPAFSAAGYGIQPV